MTPTRSAWRILPALVAALAAGCAMAPAVPLADAVASAPKAGRPGMYRLATAPLEVRLAASLAAPEGETWGPVAPEVGDLEKELIEIVKRSGTFASVGPLQPRLRKREPEDVVVLPEGETRTAVFEVAIPYRTEEVVDAAFEGGSDLVLSLEVTKSNVEYLERNWLYYPNVLNFLTWVWPAWVIADEEYAAEMEVEVVVRAAGSERAVFRRAYAERVTGRLHAMARGWKLFGTFTVPGALDADNYSQAGKRMLPHARNEIAKKLAIDLAALRDTMERDRFRGDVAQTLGVCAGVGEYRGTIQDPFVPSRDAEELAAMLTHPDRGGVPKRNIVVLTDTAPTKKKVMDALRERAGRARAGDTLWFYFAGLGFEAGGEVYLAPHDLDQASPIATAISLTELAKALAACPAKQVVVLDTSFGGEARAGTALRTLDRSLLSGLPRTTDEGAPGDRARQALTRFAAGRTVVLAAKAGAPATERSPVPQDRRGLLTARLIDAASRAQSDVERDGRLTLAEVFQAARAEATRLSARAGLTQVPEILGADGKSIVVARAPKS